MRASETATFGLEVAAFGRRQTPRIVPARSTTATAIVGLSEALAAARITASTSAAEGAAISASEPEDSDSVWARADEACEPKLSLALPSTPGCAPGAPVLTAGGRFDPPKWLQAGDIVEITVPEIGTLRNSVENEK